MPILVECPGCGARLNAPDSGAGKKVRCPKPNCGTLIPVPAATTSRADDDDRPRARRRDDDDDRPRSRRDEDDRPSKRRRDDDDRPRSQRRDDEEDDRRRARRRRDDDDEDDRPRRGRSQRKRGLGTGAIVAIALGTILVLGGIGYGIYALLGGSKSAPPPGWKEYAYRNDGFKAHFPKQPQVSGSGGIDIDAGDGKGGFGGGFVGASVTNYSCGDLNDPVHIEVMVMRYPSGVPPFVQDKFAGAADTPLGVNIPGVEVKSVRWMGGKATQIATPGEVTRMVVTDKAFYHATIRGKKGRATKQEEDGFFDNFVPAN